MSRTASYELTDIMIPHALVRIRRSGASSVWDRTRMRQEHRCVVCGQPIPKGGLAFRPLTNTQYRYERIHAEHVSELTEPGPIR